MLTPINSFDASQTTITETDNNAHIINTAVEQNVLLNKPTFVVYSVSGNYFYTIEVPDNFSPNDQFVGIFTDG